MKVLLDENFPLQLFRVLREAGFQVEHIIMNGRRGMSDAEIIERLASDEDLVFVTQDLEFENLRITRGGKVIVSRVRQQLPIERRVQIWLEAVGAFLRDSRRRENIRVLFHALPKPRLV
ncbi:MAG: DUF5615 family PIN-like protein [Actinomycetota bacterium]